MNILYRILSYFLLIIAAILGIAALFALLIALSNPALLLSVFVIVAVVIYSVASFLFLLNGIDGKRQLQTKLRDWIKIKCLRCSCVCDHEYLSINCSSSEPSHSFRCREAGI